MQGGWSNADSDWQLKRLQHDSVKTVEKAVQTMRANLQEDIIGHGQEYEKMFGKSSAQYNEYLNMVMEKLEQLGVAPKQVIEWLNQTAADGAVPVSQYGTDRDSQSETIPQIRAEPIPFDQQLQPEVDFDSFARLEAAASQALAVSINPSSALPFSAFPAGQSPAPVPTQTSFPTAQPEGNHGASSGHMSPQAPQPIAQPTFQNSLLNNSAAWASPTPGQNQSKQTAVAEAWGLGNSDEAPSSGTSPWGDVKEAQPHPQPAFAAIQAPSAPVAPVAPVANVSSSWGSPEPTNSLKSALGLAASPVIPVATTKPLVDPTDEFNYETTWSAMPARPEPVDPKTSPLSAWDTPAADEPLSSNAQPVWTPAPAPVATEPAWSAAHAAISPNPVATEPAWNAAPAAIAPAHVAAEPAWSVAPAAIAVPAAAPTFNTAAASAPVSASAFTQWGAPTNVSAPATQTVAPSESPWVTAAAPSRPMIAAPTAAPAPSSDGWASPSAAVLPQVASDSSPAAPVAPSAPAAPPAPVAQAMQVPGWPSSAPATPPVSVESAWNTPAPDFASVISPVIEPESPWTAAANSIAAESQWAAPPFPIPSPTLGPALTPPVVSAGPMMAPMAPQAPIAPSPLMQAQVTAPAMAPAPTANSVASPMPSPVPAPVPVQAPAHAPAQASVAAALPELSGAAPKPVQASAIPSPWASAQMPSQLSSPQFTSPQFTSPQPSAPMQAVAPVVSVAPVIPVATQTPAASQAVAGQANRPSFGGWPAGPVPNPYATQDAMQNPIQQPIQQAIQQPIQQLIQQPIQQQYQQAAMQPVGQGWTQQQPQQPMQATPIAAPQYHSAGYGHGGNGNQMQRPDERDEPNYDPATAWD
ncbi:hypothetical protein BH11CYA1_BH11CYA1_29400 [soil metagenome]